MRPQHLRNKLCYKQLASMTLCLTLLSGCLQTESSGTTASSTTSTTTPNPSSTADLGFAGVTSVENIDGSTIKVSWAAATNTSVVAYRVYEVAANGDLTALIQVPNSFLTYYHTGLIEGTYHSYVVRAINSSGQNDGNLAMKIGLTYSGIAGVSVTGTSSATITFTPTGASTLGANIYALARGQSFLLGTVNNTASTFNATTLRSGTIYSFKVNAITTAGTEDANSARITGQTTSLTSSKYKGALLVQAYGDAPNAPTNTPQEKQVSLTWLPFTSATSSTTYKVVRVRKGNTLDTTTTTACTSSTIVSCNVVCATGSTSLTGSTARTCIDKNIDVSPEAYDYAIVLSISSWPEELDSATESSYRISVQIPPTNMILVHRDSANYEQCALMSRISDPLNHQRCTYSGLGARPYNSGGTNSALNLSSAHFDFGYNVFVDRWEAACNWSRSADTQIGSSPSTFGTGKCGASAANGDCFGSAAPAGTVGVIGNVYYNTSAGNCYVKTGASTWTDLNSTLTTDQRALAYTNNPNSEGGKRPPIVVISQSNSNSTCAASVDSFYGPKRLLRQREFRAVAAWSNLTGEPGAVDDATMTTTETGAGATAHTTLNYCNSSTHVGITAANSFGQTGYELTRQSAAGPESFVIGSTGTKNCVSRFGAQDTIGNVWEWTSDNMTCVAGTRTCTGVTSLTDAGNGQSAGFDMNGFLFDGVTGGAGNGPGGAGATVDEWDFSAGNNSSTYFNTTLGLPLVNSNAGHAILTTTFQTSNKFHGDHLWLYAANGNTSRGLIVGGDWNSGSKNGRWASNWSAAPSGTSVNIGFRCALPAE